MTVIPGTMPALERGLDVLETLQAAPAGLGISELAGRLGVNKNAIFRITHTLTARGYLERDDVSKRFRLSAKFLQLGRPHVGEVSLTEVALPVMRSLRDQTRETVQLGLPLDDEGIIVEQVAGRHPLRIAVDVGLRFPLHNNAPGKVLLAWRPPELREATLVRITLTASTPRTITTPADLRRELDRVRELGYGTDFAEADEGIHCVAAPIFDPEARLLAAIWVSGPARRLPRTQFAAMGRLVMAFGESIARRLRGEGG